MANIRSAIINEDIITKMAELCSSFQVGQVTLCINSLYDSSMYVLSFDMFYDFYAREEGLEPPANGFGDRYSTD